jgi:predicted DNA-binding transcriptional regulator AlpA
MPNDEPTDPTCGTYEAARILGVSPQRADQLSRQEGFPAPVTTSATVNGRLVARRKWRRSDIETYAANRKEQTT